MTHDYRYFFPEGDERYACKMMTMVALQVDHEKVQSQLFELRTRQEEAAAVQLTDADLAARDLDAAHERLRCTFPLVSTLTTMSIMYIIMITTMIVM